jgi:hypothetical protein
MGALDAHEMHNAVGAIARALRELASTQIDAPPEGAADRCDGRNVSECKHSACIDPHRYFS